MRNSIAISVTIYVSGVVLYSALFVFSSNQNPLAQNAKILIAAAHSLFLIAPVILAQSRLLAARLLGYGMVIAYFVYAIFLVGFFPYFGFVPEIYAYDTESVGDLGKVADHYFKQLFGWRELALLALFALLLWQTRTLRLPGSAMLVLAVPALLLVTSFTSFGLPSDSKTFGNVTVLRRYGPVAFSYTSLAERLTLKGGYLAQKTGFPGKVAALAGQGGPPPAPVVPAVPTVSRVTLVQVESFDAMAIEARLAGVEVMPFVSKLRGKCLNYRNFFTMKGAGGSSDAEFAIATGLVPSGKLASLKHFDFTGVDTLYDRLRAHGIASSFAHNNQSGFYGRAKAYSQLGALQTRFESLARPVSELQFATDALEASLRASDKAFHYFFNFQSHGPYEGYSADTAEKFSIEGRSDIRVNYLATMSEVDQMIAEVFGLQAPGFDRGDNLFMILADHPSYLHAKDDTLGRFRIPAMICHRDFEGADIDNIFGTIDIYPTLLEAFGLEGDHPHLGQSMFWDAPNAVILPERGVIARDPDGEPAIRPCLQACDAYFAYTEQYLRF